MAPPKKTKGSRTRLSSKKKATSASKKKKKKSTKSKTRPATRSSTAKKTRAGKKRAGPKKKGISSSRVKSRLATIKQVSDQEFDRAYASSLRSRRNVEDIARDIIKNKDLHFFFTQLRKYPKYKQLVFLHRHDLFSANTEMEFPYLPFCNLPKSKKKIKKVPATKVLEHVASSEIELVSNYEFILDKVLKDHDEKIKLVLRETGDIFFYLLILFIRDNPKLKKLINRKAFDYVSMKKELGDFISTVNIEDMKDRYDATMNNGDIQFDPIIVTKAMDLQLKLVYWAAQNFEKMLLDGPKMVPNFILAIQQSTKPWLQEILTKADLSFDDYLDILTVLYRDKQIDNACNVLWCERCYIDNHNYTQINGRLSPEKLSKTKCPNCGKPQSYSTTFALNPLLREALYSTGGMLSVYIAWLLITNKVKFKSEENVNNREVDFITNKGLLIECKMFKANKDSEAIMSEVNSGISQITKQIKSLQEQGIQLRQAIIAWNRFKIPSNITQSVQQKAEELNNPTLMILNPQSIEAIVDK